MKNIVVALITSLSLAALPVYADGGRGRGNYNHQRGNYEHHNGNSSLWAGVAVIGAIAGLAILAENNRPVYAAPAPTYVEPAYPAPVNYAPAQPASNVWYYCQSSAMYYPYTKACPEGWQAVPAGTY